MGYLIDLVNGGIKEISTDSWHMDGCETCDYGSNYVSEFTVELTQGTLNIEYEKMYEYALSEDTLMKLFLINVNEIKAMTEKEFIEWLLESLIEKAGEPSVYKLEQ